jgi:hypothetical protein
MCQECEALWDHAEAVGDPLKEVSYSQYMRRHGFESAFWEDLEFLSTDETA